MRTEHWEGEHGEMSDERVRNENVKVCIENELLIVKFDCQIISYGCN